MEYQPEGTSTDEVIESIDGLEEHATEFPGHDLTELPDGESEDGEQSFPPETRDAYAEPELAPELDGDNEPEASAREEDGSASAEYPDPDASPAMPQATASASAHSDLPLTMDDFNALEERVLKAVQLVRRERQARQAAEQRAEVQEGRVLTLESQLQSLQSEGGTLEQLQQEIDTLRTERDQVRQRVERLLGQLDALEL